ncbi:MAG: bifunctional nuclease family protein [Armatimonadetes bacterium]|nr:bifunctional nuclease family protein [Armatimonadota bacterium]NIM24286.1 bifunctional nuclease family protein [Armatimonadota bacterium]NIM68155.1 bifunctional nuclease family protein [Armatimonadota bacterium]NIM76615.1 bifunctional nuclease family protein [Armatimonadota bacterium]NIN06360.1 bifunctional nuclease family protein [Armatimonadota bacterium]
MVQLKVNALEAAEGSPLVRITLQDIAGERQIQIWVGWPEAAAIQSHLEGNTPPRPMTHDLTTNILSLLEAKVLQLLISDMKEGTFYATLTVSANGRVHEVDCRPSDGIAIAVRCGAPIFISEDLLATIEKLDEQQGMEAPPPGAIVVESDDTTIH